MLTEIVSVMIFFLVGITFITGSILTLVDIYKEREPNDRWIVLTVVCGMLIGYSIAATH